MPYSMVRVRRSGAVWRLAGGLIIVMGCAAGEAPTPASPPAAGPAIGPSEVTGAPDSVAGTTVEGAYRYKFRMIDPPSDRFNFRDRVFDFYFRPAPDALHFQIENRQGFPITIEWDRCQFYDFSGGYQPAIHDGITWENRFRTPAPTTIQGGQRYSDYVFPLDLMLDPGGTGGQLHKPLIPQDSSAPHYIDRPYGVDLVFRFDDKLNTYSFRFKLVSVLPN